MPNNNKHEIARQNRINYVLEEYGNRLLKKFESQEKTWPEVESVQDLVTLLSKADPTKAGKAMKWLAETYIKSGFRLEDIERVKETLILYATHSKELPESQRGLSRYKSEAELWKAIEGFVDQGPVISNKEQDRRDKAKAYAESEIIYQGEEGIIAVPRSEFAAKWWGKGTRWCTAGDKANMYNHYAKQGDLFVIVLKDGSKYQTHMETRQFVDSSDDSVDVQDFIEQYNWIKKVQSIHPCLIASKNILIKEDWVHLNKDQKISLIKYSPHIIQHFANTATPEERLQAIKQDGDCISYLLNLTNSTTSDERIEAIKENTHCIRHFADTATPQERLFAVKKNGHSVQHFIDTATSEERLEAVKQDGESITHFSDIATPEERMTAIRQK